MLGSFGTLAVSVVTDASKILVTHQWSIYSDGHPAKHVLIHVLSDHPKVHDRYELPKALIGWTELLVQVPSRARAVKEALC